MRTGDLRFGDNGAMSMSGDSGQRVGNAEREAAVQALNQHWQAGRLDPAEHERRTTAAYAAVTRADLDALFNDLPGGDLATRAGDAPAPLQGDVVGASPGVSAPAESASTWIRRNRNGVMGAMPFIALALFFATKWWVWFLLIPAAGAILYAGGGDDDGRNRNRNRRRD
jgi:hypothetical protein